MRTLSMGKGHKMQILTGGKGSSRLRSMPTEVACFLMTARSGKLCRMMLQINIQQLFHDANSNLEVKTTELNHNKDKDEGHQVITKIEKLQRMVTSELFYPYSHTCSTTNSIFSETSASKVKTPLEVNVSQHELTTGHVPTNAFTKLHKSTHHSDFYYPIPLSQRN